MILTGCLFICNPEEREVKGMSEKGLKWLKCAGVRAIKTVAQTAVATIGTATMMGEVDWFMIGSASLLAGVLSILTSIAGLPEMKE